VRQSGRPLTGFHSLAYDPSKAEELSSAERRTGRFNAVRVLDEVLPSKHYNDCSETSPLPAISGIDTDDALSMAEVINWATVNTLGSRWRAAVSQPPPIANTLGEPVVPE
jgi:hypothetical protein